MMAEGGASWFNIRREFRFVERFFWRRHVFFGDDVVD